MKIILSEDVMKYIFIIMLILSIAAPFVLDYSYSGVRTKKKRIAAKASTAVMLALIAGGILDVFAQVNNSPVYGSFALISVFEAIQFALIALNYKNNFKATIYPAAPCAMLTSPTARLLFPQFS